jgi:hypothetical protein
MEMLYWQLGADRTCSSLQQQLAEAQAAFQSRSQEHDLKRRELQGVEAQYREADVSQDLSAFLYMLSYSSVLLQAKLKRAKSGRSGRYPSLIWNLNRPSRQI